MTGRLFKVLNEDGTSCHGGCGAWSLPSDDTPGEWMPAIEGKLIACENGYHLCRKRDLLEWLGPAIFEAEYRGERMDTDNKVVVREARLLRRLNWCERVARLFACDCAERVLSVFEVEYPGDDRPRRAIATARRYAVGEVIFKELAAAKTAASDAASDAAWDAASDAAWVAARAAARAAAGATAWNAAWDAARDATWAAARAARAATRDASAAAWDATWDAAWAAARDAEQEWQTVRLIWYLDGEFDR